MRIKALLFLTIIPTIVWGQPFTISSNNLSFGTLNYTEVDSLSISISNTLSVPLEVEGIQVFDVFAHTPFYVKDSIFTVAAGANYDIWVYFEPEQNISHDMKLVLKTGYRGDYLIDLKGDGSFSNTYYNSTFNKSEQALKSSLKTLLGQGYQQQSYNGARDNMYGSIDNDGGDVTCVYTGRVATFNTRPGANANNFNCEHTFPQGFFSQALPMKSDIHHLFPTDVTANSQRGNERFGVVTGNPSWSVGGSKKGQGSSGIVFEPRDDHKGAVARALFYFVVRYQDYSSHVAGQEATLRTWFNQYGPSSKEIQRNNDIYAIQNNRNPFVDYPQFLKRISKISGNSVPVESKSIYVSRDSINMSGELNDLVYTVSFVNNGNSPVTLSNFGISNTDYFDFVSPVSDTTLAVGQGMEIEIKVDPANNVDATEFLTFNTDIPNLSNGQIVLKGKWISIGVQDQDLTNTPVVFPNPAEQFSQITWTEKTFDLLVMNSTGHLVMTYYNVREGLSLPCQNLSTGVYFLQFISQNQLVTKKLLIQ